MLLEPPVRDATVDKFFAVDRRWGLFQGSVNEAPERRRAVVADEEASLDLQLDDEDKKARRPPPRERSVRIEVKGSGVQLLFANMPGPRLESARQRWRRPHHNDGLLTLREATFCL